MSGETLTPELVRGLLEGATPGEWAVGKIKTYAVFPCHPARPRPQAIATVPHWSGETEPADEQGAADVRLIAAAPALARTVLEQAGELERLRDGERQLREYFTALAESDHHESAQDAYRHAAEMVAAVLASPAAAEAGQGEG